MFRNSRTLLAVILFSFLKAQTAWGAGELQEAIAIFEDFSTVSRLTDHEEAAVAWLKAKYDFHAARTWANDPGLKYRRDATGNSTVELPATGRFKGLAGPTVAVQVHVDMYGAVKGVTNAGEVRPHFKDGVKLETTGGRFQDRCRVAVILSDRRLFI